MKQIYRFLSLTLSLFVFISALSGCSGDPSNSQASANEGSTSQTASSNDMTQGSFKIAVAASMTGENAEFGLGYRDATQLAVDEWNANGGVLGMQVEVVSFDDKGSGDEAAAVAQKICTDEDIVAVMGHFSSGISMTAGVIYQENGMIQIDSSSSHTDLTKTGDYIFQNNNLTYIEGQAAVDIAVQEHGGKTIGMIYIESDWGNSAATVAVDYFNETYADQGITLVGPEFVLTGAGNDDYSLAIAKMVDAGVDVCIVGGEYGLSAPVCKQYKQVDPEIKFTGYSSCYSQYLLDLAGDAVEGLIFPISFYPESEDPLVKNFMEKYESNFETSPTSYAVQCYDGVNLLFETIEKVGSLDRAAIRDALAQATYDGVAGHIEFDEERHVTRTPVRLVIKDGKFVEYTG